MRTSYVGAPKEREKEKIPRCTSPSSPPARSRDRRHVFPRFFPGARAYISKDWTDGWMDGRSGASCRDKPSRERRQSPSSHFGCRRAVPSPKEQAGYQRVEGGLCCKFLSTKRRRWQKVGDFALQPWLETSPLFWSNIHSVPIGLDFPFFPIDFTFCIHLLG